MANLAVTLSGAVIQVINSADSSVRVNSSWASPSLAAAVETYIDFLPVTVGALVLTLPAGTIWVLGIRNLGGINGTPAGNITVQYQVTGGALNSAANSPIVLPGGVFAYWQQVETAGGIIAVTLTASVAATPVEIIMAQ